MEPYAAKLDWEINRKVKNELVKRGLNLSKIKISSTRGIVELRGELEFLTAQSKTISPEQVQLLLHQLDLSIRAIPGVKMIKWKIKNWQKMGTRWLYRPAKY